MGTSADRRHRLQMDWWIWTPAIDNEACIKSFELGLPVLVYLVFCIDLCSMQMALGEFLSC